jgi:hypothetical protein
MKLGMAFQEGENTNSVFVIVSKKTASVQNYNMVIAQSLQTQQLIDFDCRDAKWKFLGTWDFNLKEILPPK